MGVIKTTEMVTLMMTVGKTRFDHLKNENFLEENKVYNVNY